MTIQRFEDWPKRLSAYIIAHREIPFAWRENDCLSFVANCVKELTGKDFYASFNNYTDEATARELMELNGGAEGIITQCLGEPKRSPRYATRGDVALVMGPEPCAGIVDDSGQRVAVMTEKGMIRAPLRAAVKVWGY